VELVNYETNCADQKKIGIASASEEVFARFWVVFLGVLVCLIVFFDGQDVKYDCGINPHPHLSRGTNSHRAEKQYTENGEKQRKRE